MDDELYFPLDALVDPHRLATATEQLLERVQLAFERTRQLALHTFAGSADPWYDGCRKQRDIGADSDYDILNPELRGTYFEEVFGLMPFKPFRARLMSLDPAVCYSIHRDQTPRYHIAIKTTPQARFVFTERQRIVHIPADGRVYFVDTREEHTAFNGGTEPRIHLVVGGADRERA